MFAENKSIFTLTIRKDAPGGGSYMIRAGQVGEVDDRSWRVWCATSLGRALLRDGLVLESDGPATAPATVPDAVFAPEPAPEAVTEPISLDDMDWTAAVEQIKSMTDTAELEALHEAEKRKRVKRAIEDRILELIK